MSIFFNPSRILVSFQLKEAVAHVIGTGEDLTFEEAIITAYQLIGKSTPKKAELEIIAQRLFPQDEPSAKPDAPAASTGKGMGTALMQWHDKLPTDRLCLLTCDFDMERARALYCDIDMADCEAAISLKLELIWQQLRATFESSLYAFGGKLQGDEGHVETKVVDMQDSAQVLDMISEFRSMGF